MKNKFKSLITTAVLLCVSLSAGSQASAARYWVFFEHADGWTSGDPVSDLSLTSVAIPSTKIMTVSRYFDAVSVSYDGDPAELSRITGVREVRPVRSLARAPVPFPEKPSVPAVLPDDSGDHTLNYGTSYNQLNWMNIPALHDAGLSGEGILIGVLDAGFDDLAQTGCLENVRVLHTRNFIRNDDSLTGDSHGSHVLACLGGVKEGEYYGPAYGASYILAVTDDRYTESRLDEARWVAAVEWCDSLGADIISSSLVYSFGFDDPLENYTPADMDGQKSLVARAAEIAVSHGIIMVNSAGNEGDNYWRIVTTPADAEHVIAVGAVTMPASGEPVIASFSSRGPTADGRIKPDITAPGYNIVVPITGSANRYTTTSGTSFAAPLVSGLCALLLEASRNATPSDMITSLKETSTDLGAPGPDNVYGWGYPDGVSALEHLVLTVDVDDTPLNVGSANENGLAPQIIELNNPFPNPFNASVSIPFLVASESPVKVDVVDVMGHVVAELWDQKTLPGEYQVSWNAAGYATGVYFARAIANGFTSSTKVLLIK